MQVSARDCRLGIRSGVALRLSSQLGSGLRLLGGTFCGNFRLMGLDHIVWQVQRPFLATRTKQQGNQDQGYRENEAHWEYRRATLAGMRVYNTLLSIPFA